MNILFKCRVFTKKQGKSGIFWSFRRVKHSAKSPLPRGALGEEVFHLGEEVFPGPNGHLGFCFAETIIFTEMSSRRRSFPGDHFVRVSRASFQRKSTRRKSHLGEMPPRRTDPLGDLDARRNVGDGVGDTALGKEPPRRNASRPRRRWHSANFRTRRIWRPLGEEGTRRRSPLGDTLDGTRRITISAKFETLPRRASCPRGFLCRDGQRPTRRRSDTRLPHI